MGIGYLNVLECIEDDQMLNYLGVYIAMAILIFQI